MHRILCNAPEVGRPVDMRQSCRVRVGAGRGHDCHSRGPGDAFTFAVGSLSLFSSSWCFYLPWLPPLRPVASMTRALDVGRTARRGNSSHDTRYIRQAKPPAAMAPAGAAAHKISLHNAAQAFSWRCTPLFADRISDVLAEMRNARPGAPAQVIAGETTTLLPGWLYLADIKRQTCRSSSVHAHTTPLSQDGGG
jgi:hypothetical protein